jgi:hypothetical protein
MTVRQRHGVGLGFAMALGVHGLFVNKNCGGTGCRWIPELSEVKERLWIYVQPSSQAPSTHPTPLGAGFKRTLRLNRDCSLEYSSI